MSDSRMSTYKPLPIDLVKGQGAIVTDSQGQEYLDALAGIAVCSLGHAHPAVHEAICEQSKKLLHCSNLYSIAVQHQLADKLTSLSNMDNVFFGNSGAEANEAAIKIARLYGHNKDIKNPTIIVMENAFHGRTLATLTASGSRKVQAGFEPLVQGFIRVPYNDIDAIKSIAATQSDVVAILVEPVQGEAGVIVPDKNYLENLRTICDDNEWLLMLDEIQTGLCRTGKWFAFQHSDIQPDVMTLAKSLGNGIPIGACLAKGIAAQTLQPGNHGSTYGGNPLVCATSLAVLGVMESEALYDKSSKTSQRIVEGFKQRLKDIKGVQEITSFGMMFGIALDRDCPELMLKALDKNILINVTSGNRIRLLPPLIISDQQADKIVELVSELVIEFLQD
ncbi:Acetylornithine aminotransferase [hydrothermal vent metagenome]|uniref:Acetylornithine aminotransferase n=1 Tax=hydrothermal vent metagenome TaxID=652676 RepID=A0A3B0Y8W9_9ZZZZ